MNDFWNKKKSIIRSDILVNSELLKIIGDVKGKTILDLGCGDGTIAASLSKKGAKVVGVDKKEHSIKLAKEKDGKYLCKDIRKVNLKKNEFDVIYSSMVFLFLSDKEIKDLAKKIYHWLKKKGVFVISDIHPTTEIQGDNSFWVKHDIPNNFDYFKTSEVKATLRNKNNEKSTFTYFHRSLSTYIEHFTSAGLKMIDLCEPQATKELMHKFHLGFENKNPAYIILKFIKD
ncbi:methyltransferase domain-containing protein [Patescibacteria group bacterium]|nr:methyltransferase domain-containing protein [Patescibacteria group bacterium]MBU4477002.1 methyltransferase domain-containing protein [Patescibacteria group bacterium]MCG2698827.1 methyltransferase domain-containing protein [Candidatus Parcubacteria bacterium]